MEPIVIIIFVTLWLLVYAIKIDRLIERLGDINKSLKAIQGAIEVSGDNLMNRD